MARPREFEPADALRAAVQVFWERGFLDTSMDDLVEGTGVSRYGLYSTFGNKHELFLASLDHYLEIVNGRLAPMLAANASVKDIERFLLSFLEMSATDIPKGCMLCNASTELGDTDPLVKIRTDKYIELFRRAFRNALRCSVRRGELPKSTNVVFVADRIEASLLGLFVMSRAGQPRKKLEAVVHGIIDGLPG